MSSVGRQESIIYRIEQAPILFPKGIVYVSQKLRLGGAGKFTTLSTQGWSANQHRSAGMQFSVWLNGHSFGCAPFPENTQWPPLTPLVE